VKPLIAIPSPRDINSVYEAVCSVDFIDRLWVKYTRPEYKTYEYIQEFFLSRKQYTHLIIWPDDLVATRDHVWQLLYDILEYDFEVIGGICQIDNDWYYDKMIISLKALYPNRNDRFRYFEKFEDYYWHDKLKPEYEKNPIIRTMWQGFPLTCIRRDVLEQIQFRNDHEFNDLPKELGCCIDDVFCWDCIQNEIQTFTDLRIRMNHLKINDNNSRMLFVDKKPEILYDLASSELVIEEKKLG
jgi:hypothetical protein